MPHQPCIFAMQSVCDVYIVIASVGTLSESQMPEIDLGQFPGKRGRRPFLAIYQRLIENRIICILNVFIYGKGVPMPRLARVVFSGVPHHITQRGNRRQDTFFDDDGRIAYLEFRGHNTQSSAFNFGPDFRGLNVLPQNVSSFSINDGEPRGCLTLPHFAM